MTITKFLLTLQEAKHKNMDVINIDSYILNSELRFSCVIRKCKSGNAQWEVFHFTSSTDLQNKCDAYKSQEKVLKCLTCQYLNEIAQLTALFVKDSRPTWWKVDMDSEIYQRQCDKQSHYGHMPSHIKAYEQSDTTQFCAVWSNPGPYRYTSEHDLSRYRLLNDLTLTSESGFYPLCVAGYEEDGDHKFAAICVKETTSR